MKKQNAKTIQTLRIVSQWIFTLLFLYLFLLPLFQVNVQGPSAAYFFYFDPLLMINGLILTKTIAYLFLLSLIPLLLSLVVGKFFCGWICPMGAIQQFSSWIFRTSLRKKNGYSINLLKIKYLFLVFVIVSAVFGANYLTWFDPFSLITRSLASFMPKTLNGYLPTHSLLTVAVFILILILNAYHTRFFCNIICPLGAVYGIVSRFGLFRLQSTEACNDCHKCSTHCSYGGNAGEKFIKSECIVCFNCVVDCPSEAVDVRFGNPAKAPLVVVNPGRRNFFGTIALGVTAAFLSKLDYSSKPGVRHSFIRPPGALNENTFLDYCQRCSQCVQACPTGFIQPAISQAGIVGVWTPVVSAQSGYCEWSCNKCTQVCPSGAIEKLTLKRKQEFKIGIAVIDKDRCYTYADGYNCSVCHDGCPIPQKAIRYRETETWNFQGRKVNVKQIYVDPDRCTGCGICENLCPRTDAPGIFITAQDEYRAMIN